MSDSEHFRRGLSERGDEWVVTFFVAGAVTQQVEQDLIEVSGDAETFLEEVVPAEVHATDAIKRRIRSVIVGNSSRRIPALQTQCDRLLLAHDPTISRGVTSVTVTAAPRTHMCPPTMVGCMKAQKYLFSLVIVTVMYFTVAVLLSPGASGLSA